MARMSYVDPECPKEPHIRNRVPRGGHRQPHWASLRIGDAQTRFHVTRGSAQRR